MKISIHRTADVQRSIRVRQLESLFDCPAVEKLDFTLEAELPIEEKNWNVGLIVGPSGSGKTQTLVELFGPPTELCWDPLPDLSATIDFVHASSIDDITEAFQAVGFNTIPNWMRPFYTLSNGEQFRATLARVLVEGRERNKGPNKGWVVMDEFTSVVDRQVAKIGSFAVGKYARKYKLQFVAASCHYDIIDWLQPDWIFEPATGQFQWRALQFRPDLYCRVGRVPYGAWHQFARFHYMSQDLNKAARCYGLWCEGKLATFCGVLHRPHPRVRDIMGISRIVTLPDWQGLGLAMVLADKLGGAYAAVGKRFRNYPNHPAFVRSHERSHNWKKVKESGSYSPARGDSSSVAGFGGRSCAVFEYIGMPLSVPEAKAVLGDTK